MNIRKLAITFIVAVGIAGIANSHAEDSLGDQTTAEVRFDSVAASFERDRNRQPGRTAAPNGRTVETDVLYALVNRPLQTRGEKSVVLVAAANLAAAGKGE